MQGTVSELFTKVKQKLKHLLVALVYISTVLPFGRYGDLTPGSQQQISLVHPRFDGVPPSLIGGIRVRTASGI